MIWIGNLLACLIFGAAHLPQGARFTGGLSPQLITAALVGNGVPGLMFGWLYWRKGLIAAMVCHALADIMIKVLPPAIRILTQSFNCGPSQSRGSGSFAP